MFFHNCWFISKHITSNKSDKENEIDLWNPLSTEIWSLAFGNTRTYKKQFLFDIFLYKAKFLEKLRSYLQRDFFITSLKWAQGS